MILLTKSADIRICAPVHIFNRLSHIAKDMIKTIFTNEEYEEVLQLVRQKLEADSDTQKKIRKHIRKIGFRWNDLANRKSGFDVEGVQNLLSEGRITLVDGRSIVHRTTKSEPKVNEPKNVKRTNSSSSILKTVFDSADFFSQAHLSRDLLQKTGFYAIRLKGGSSLPIRYQSRLNERQTRIIYIGKAEGQSLSKRLGQELQHSSPGTFFRSIGAVLGKTPIPGSLNDYSNKKNYKFKISDTQEIIDWLSENVDVAIAPFSGDFSIENEIIANYSPLLNHTGNPNKCLELMEDRAECRRIANQKT
jgi:hypothetical protein